MTKNYKTIQLNAKYVPKKTEKYMSIEQKAYFYNLLNARRAEILASIENDLAEMSSSISIDSMDGTNDEADNSSSTQQVEIQMKIMDRGKNMLFKIDAMLEKLENGTYGYSVISGNEIGLKRLLAQPLATMTLEEKEEHDRNDP
jgi:DnaK suppressor protein